MSAAHSIWAKVAVITLAAGVCLAVGMMAPETPKTPPTPNVVTGPPPFSRWPEGKKPDLAIVITGEQHSYIKFCGCSAPQLGGFERRANLIAELKAKDWPVIALDLGDIVYRKSGSVQAQTLLKYKTSMQALNLLGYSVIGVGENEFNLPLIDGLAQYTLQKPGAAPRILAANLKNRADDFPSGVGKESMIGDAVVIAGKAGQVKVGTLTLVGPSVQENIADKKIEFEANAKVIAGALGSFAKADVTVRVLLYQGTPDEATALAKKHPEFHLIICKSPQEQPPPIQMINNTMLAMVGQKGQHVGIAGIFRDATNPKKFELHWEKIALGETYETPEAKVAEHSVIKLMQEYAQQVKDQNLLALYPKMPHPMKVKYPADKVEFVGSQKCQECHQADYAIWKKSQHAHAYDSLVNHAKKPTLRQFDGECVICHTIGFAYASGYKNEQLTPNLKDVGCENCHGPGSLHVAQPNNATYYGDLSPWKSKPTDRVMLADGKYDSAVLLRIDSVCQKCHDTDNDPKFKFEEYWPKITHGKRAAPAAVINGAAAPKK